MKRPLILTFTVLAMGAVACGGGDDKPSKLSTGVDGSKSLGSLQPAEQQKICTATQEYAASAFDQSKFKQFNCKIAGVLAGAFTTTDEMAKMACTGAYDACMKQADAPPMTNNATCGKFSEKCTATVAEYEACMNDFKDGIQGVSDAIPSCATFTRAQLTSLASIGMKIPASCQTFTMKCEGGITSLPGVPAAAGSLGR